MTREEKIAFINRRQRQLLVHSCLYYRMNESIVPDHVFDAWSVQLVRLKEEAADLFKESIYAQSFEDFDGSSGYHLPYWKPEIVRAAEKLISRPN